MTRNLPFKSLFKTRNPKSSSSSSSSSFFPSPSPWAWPSCKQPKTLSFRLLTEEPEDDDHSAVCLDSTDQFFCFTSSSAISFDVQESVISTSDCSVEAAMQAVSSNRLLVDGRWSSSTITSKKEVDVAGVREVPFKGSVAVAVESEDLHRDFLASMKEMVEAGSGEASRDFGWLEEMLAWYLLVNQRWTHQFIIAAYCDLLFEMTMVGDSSSSSASSSSSSRNCSINTSDLLPSSCSSPSSSLYVSCLSEISEEVEEEGDR